MEDDGENAGVGRNELDAERVDATEEVRGHPVRADDETRLGRYRGRRHDPMDVFRRTILQHHRNYDDRYEFKIE